MADQTRTAYGALGAETAHAVLQTIVRTAQLAIDDLCKVHRRLGPFNERYGSSGPSWPLDKFHRVLADLFPESNLMPTWPVVPDAALLDVAGKRIEPGESAIIQQLFAAVASFILAEIDLLDEASDFWAQVENLSGADLAEIESLLLSASARTSIVLDYSESGSGCPQDVVVSAGTESCCADVDTAMSSPMELPAPETSARRRSRWPVKVRTGRFLYASWAWFRNDLCALSRFLSDYSQTFQIVHYGLAAQAVWLDQSWRPAIDVANYPSSTTKRSRAGTRSSEPLTPRWRFSPLQGLGNSDPRQHHIASRVWLAGTAAVGAGLGVIDLAYRSPYAMAGAVGATITAILIARRHWRSRGTQPWESDVSGGCLAVDGRLPRVREVNPIQLGVRTAPYPLVDSDLFVHYERQPLAHPDWLLPPYVPRDMDGRVREALATGGHVVLFGTCGAGTTRTAIEALMATVPDHLLIAPRCAEDLPGAVAKFNRSRQCVLWLDGLDQFLVTAPSSFMAMASAYMAADGHRIVLGTVRFPDYTRLIDDIASDAMSPAVRGFLEDAQHIHLDNKFSSSEKQRARARMWDPRVALALRHADAYGLAEYLAAGPELWRLYMSARNSTRKDSPSQHLRAAALVAAAIDLSRVGFRSPIHRRALEQAHHTYLEKQRAQGYEIEPLDEAWQWATTPHKASAALLQPHGKDRVEVFDYLVHAAHEDTKGSDGIAETTVLEALEFAALPDADSVAAISYHEGRYRSAEAAVRRSLVWRGKRLRPEHPDTLTSRSSLAATLTALCRHAEAETEYRDVLVARSRILGPDHPDTLAARSGLALVLAARSRFGEAEAEYRAILAIRTRVLGARHPDTLATRSRLASLLDAQGRSRRISQARPVADDPPAESGDK